MGKSTIDKLIINSPYEEPKQYWSYDRETRQFNLKEGRRPAGYVVATEHSKSFDDPGKFIEIPLVIQIRPRVKAWREAGYPGITGITKRLLEHWNNLEERTYRRFFFCQLEAIETLIWLVEAPDSEKVGIEIPSDGGVFKRICSKMATGSGKTIVMAQLIAWQVLNKVAYPQDSRFSKNIFVVAPGLTVKNRLQVLMPSDENNYYQEFNIIPSDLMEKLRLGKVQVSNWHVLNWQTEEQLKKKKSVDKRGAKSDEAYVREVLGEMATASNILVINDEAHHAWRIPAESKEKGVKKEEEEATIWIGGLDRIQEARGILTCFDFSATPFTPTGKKTSEEALFGWIVSDFGLSDAIESGLVKTPRVVIRDDGIPNAKNYKSKLYHIYEHIKDDLNRKADEKESLPDLVVNGYYLLGKDWLETYKDWKKRGSPTPPVMISVANRIETAARIKYSFDHNKIRIEELCDPDKTLHIDSKVLDIAEAQEEPMAKLDFGDSPAEEETENKGSRKEQAELIRQKVATVGQPGRPGEKIQNVISVSMLSEGWDAKTVTHIMGLRAFSSQLLCEQVVGRGLRRTTYEVNEETGLFDPEYVNIFGVPFTFLPHESQDDGPPPPPPSPKTRIEPVKEKRQFEIKWPNIIRVEHTYKPTLTLDMDGAKPLQLNANDTRQIAEIAPIIEGKPDTSKITSIQLEDLGRRFRMQKIIFETARDVYDQMKKNWKGNREYLLGQIILIVEKFIGSKKLRISPAPFEEDDVKKRILITLNISKIVNHIWENIRFENTDSILPVYDTLKPIRSTTDVATWYTGKPCVPAQKSHINFCINDSTWEDSAAFKLDHNKSVEAWVKNDHLGFVIHYIFDGVVHKYFPDFIIRLNNGTHFILEVKGQDSQQNKTKREFLNEWVIAVNNTGSFGKWNWAVSKNPGDIDKKIKEALDNV